MRCRILAIALLLTVAQSLTTPRLSIALPFNTDMMDKQPITGSIMRPKEPGSVAFGSLADRVETRDEALKLENPLKGDALSIASGERLFSTNCAPCHGRWTEGKHQAGSLPAMMPSVDRCRSAPRN